MRRAVFMFYTFFSRLLIWGSLLFVLSCNRYYVHDLYKETFSVNHFEMLRIDGIRHAVLVRGQDSSNPVMIYIHGGPGFPLFPFEPRSQAMERMEEMFTMVYWEQRGTGKSFSRAIQKESMTLAQFVEDSRKVTEFALELTGQDKAFIWGHSWGSNVGVLLADQHPHLIHAYIGTGQSVNPYLNERLCYQFVEQQAGRDNNRFALRQLEWVDTLPENYSIRDALTVRRWVYRYGGVVQKQQQQRPYVDLQEIRHMLTAAEYSISDRIDLMLHPYFSAELLWDEMKSLDLMEMVPELQVPVYFLLGRHDVIVSSDLAAEYFSMLKAPRGKHLIWFENAAHRPHSEETDLFIKEMNSIRSRHWPADSR